MEYSMVSQDKTFLGKDFLTWLMAKSIIDNGKFKYEGIEPFEVYFEKNITFSSDWENKEKSILKGQEPAGGLGALIALMEGKKVEKANLHFIYREQDWRVIVTASTLDFSSFKTSLPRQMFPEDAVVTRFSTFESFRTFFLKIYEIFLKLRISSEKWKSENRKIDSLLKSQIQLISNKEN